MLTTAQTIVSPTGPHGRRTRIHQTRGSTRTLISLQLTQIAKQPVKMGIWWHRTNMTTSRWLTKFQPLG